ncbi:MAG TPA: serine/threonine-protein kinase, partial [Pirellulaceae bacterium]|nr:serine/threonine-protein kinase [Pirellulaceae bacterium]
MTDHSSTAGDPDSDLDSLADDPRVLGVAEEYLLALEAGQTPDRQAYLARYPELAGALAHCFDALELVHSGIAGESRPAHESHVTLPNELTGQPPSPLGDFQIVREIARGGMGVVYEAIQLSLGRRVALKVLPFAATFDSRQLQRFKNEAHAAALLHHTHIVPIYAVGCERGVHFYAMQLIDGQSLAVVIQQLRTKEGRAAKAGSLSSLQVADRQLDSTTDRNLPALPRPARSSQALQSTINMADTFTSGSSRTSEAYIRRAARLIVQAADALEHAHQEGVVHRDIKPANLLLDTLGKVWVTDFGLAQLQADNGLTRSGDVLGTFRYMSPEQTSGQRTMLDHRTDIYSLGATLYELLALEPVFAGETHQELLYQILHTEPRSLRELNRAVPQELETIVLKSLSKNAADRYRTVGEFAADIQRYLDHQPILARRPSLIDRGRKWARRHPAAVVATVLILAVVTALSLVSNWRIGVAQQRTTDALLREQQRATEAEERF